MFRKLICAAVVMVVAVGVLAAEELKGRIMKIDDKKVSFATVKDKKLEEAKNYDLVKDCKFCAMVKKEKQPLDGGLTNERLKTIGDKGVGATIVTNNDGKVTEIILTGKK